MFNPNVGMLIEEPVKSRIASSWALFSLGVGLEHNILQAFCDSKTKQIITIITTLSAIILFNRNWLLNCGLEPDQQLFEREIKLPLLKRAICQIAPVACLSFLYWSLIVGGLGGLVNSYILGENFSDGAFDTFVPTALMGVLLAGFAITGRALEYHEYRLTEDRLIIRDRLDQQFLQGLYNPMEVLKMVKDMLPILGEVMKSGFALTPLVLIVWCLLQGSITGVINQYAFNNGFLDAAIKGAAVSAIYPATTTALGIWNRASFLYECRRQQAQLFAGAPRELPPMKCYENRLEELYKTELVSLFTTENLVQYINEEFDETKALSERAEIGREMVRSMDSYAMLTLPIYLQMKELEGDIYCPKNSMRYAKLVAAKTKFNKLTDTEKETLKTKILNRCDLAAGTSQEIVTLFREICDLARLFIEVQKHQLHKGVLNNL